MRLEEAIYTRLSTFAPLAALVAGRIYAVRAPQSETRPRITYQRISGASDHVLSGPSGLTDTRVQVDCWADDPATSSTPATVTAYAQARDVALQVKAALDGFRGLVTSGESPSDSLRIKSTRLENDQDLPEEERRLSRVSLDFIIGHDEET